MGGIVADQFQGRLVLAADQFQLRIAFNGSVQIPVLTVDAGELQHRQARFFWCIS